MTLAEQFLEDGCLNPRVPPYGGRVTWTDGLVDVEVLMSDGSAIHHHKGLWKLGSHPAAVIKNGETT